MIKIHPNGKHYCDGKYCGFPLSWQECDPEEGADGAWTCLDCGSSMWAARPTREDDLRAMGEPDDSLMLGGCGGGERDPDLEWY